MPSPRCFPALFLVPPWVVFAHVCVCVCEPAEMCWQFAGAPGLSGATGGACARGVAPDFFLLLLRLKVVPCRQLL